MMKLNLWVHRQPGEKNKRHGLFTRVVSIQPILGFGFWRDDYSKTFPAGSHMNNVVLPFLRIQWGVLYFPEITPNPDLPESKL